jgi:hypothetical protein
LADGSTDAFVGYGDNSGCNSQNPCPGLLINNPIKPGGFYGCGSVTYRKAGNFYLLNHPDLKWLSTNSTHISTLTTTISVNSGQRLFNYGRFMENGVPYLGKACTNDGCSGKMRKNNF